MDHGVPQLTVSLLDLSHVDVLDRIAVDIEPDRPSRGIGDLHFAQGFEKRLTILDVPPDGLGRLIDPTCASVACFRKIRGNLAVLRPVLFDEARVRWGIQGRAVDERTDPTDGFIAKRGKDELVEGRTAADER